MSDQIGVALRKIVEAGDYLARNDEDVRGSLRIDVAKCDAPIVIVDHLGGYFAVGYFLKERLAFSHFLIRIILLHASGQYNEH